MPYRFSNSSGHVRAVSWRGWHIPLCVFEFLTQRNRKDEIAFTKQLLSQYLAVLVVKVN